MTFMFDAQTDRDDEDNSNEKKQTNYERMSNQINNAERSVRTYYIFSNSYLHCSHGCVCVRVRLSLVWYGLQSHRVFDESSLNS